MVFDIQVGIESNSDKKLIKRHAVRAVIFKDDKILMLSSKRGDYKLPGGGIEYGESELEALHREIKEETGYLNTDIKMKIGRYLERKIDKYDPECIFEMTSEYYLCAVNGQSKELALTSIEEALGMEPTWIDLDEVISANERFFMNRKGEDLWTSRELKVLKILKNKLPTLTIKY